MTITRFLNLTAIILLLAGPLAANSPANGRSVRARSACSEANISDVLLDGPTQIDGVRVVVSRRSPIGGAVTISVDDGESDRVVHIRGARSKLLQFRPALSAAEFQVAMTPVFEAKRGACVERIELLQGSSTVATITPR